MSLSNCIIQAGFETVALRSQADYSLIPTYPLHNCTVTKIENDADTPSTYPCIALVSMDGGIIKVPSCSNNSLKMCYLQALGVTVTQLAANTGGYQFMSCYISGSVTSPNATHNNPSDISYISCCFYGQLQDFTVDASWILTSRLHSSATITHDGELYIDNCKGITSIVCNKDVYITNSAIELQPVNGGNIDQLYVARSEVDLTRPKTNVGSQSIFGITTDAVSSYTVSALSSPHWTITYDHSRNNIMYSANASGSNMTKDSTGASYYGIAKDVALCRFEPTDYMWFPMPS